MEIHSYEDFEKLSFKELKNYINSSLSFEERVRINNYIHQVMDELNNKEINITFEDNITTEEVLKENKNDK